MANLGWLCVNAPTPHPDSLSCVTSLKSALNSLPLLVNWPYWCVRGHATRRRGERGGAALFGRCLDVCPFYPRLT